MRSKATTSDLVQGARQSVAQNVLRLSEALAMHVAYATNRHVWLKVRDKVLAFGAEHGWKTSLIEAALADVATRTYTPDIVQMMTHCNWGNPYIVETEILAEWVGCDYTDMTFYTSATKALGERAASQLIELMTGMTKWDDFSYLFHFYPQLRPLFNNYSVELAKVRSFRRPPRKLPSWLSSNLTPPGASVNDLLSLCLQCQAAGLLQ